MVDRIGARYRLNIADTQLQTGLELGVFLPGSAFNSEMVDMGPVFGGRAMMAYRF